MSALRSRVRRLGFALMAGLGMLVTGCGDRAALETQQEIAGELRALRLQLQEKVTAGVPERPALDAAAFATALEPLREVMTVLVTDMAELQTRQSTLTGEMQRWSQLLAQTATGSGQEQAKALTARLQDLEQAMKAQDERHREVEALVTRALEHTSERLESFLQRLEGIGKDGPDGVQAPSEATRQEPATAPAPGKVGNEAPAGEPRPAAEEGGGPDRQAREASRRTPDSSPWWFAIAAAAILAGGMFAFWLRGENAAGAVLPAAGPGEAGVDGEAQELWAAAALLGEAVGRLRQSGAEPVEAEGEPGAAAAAPSVPSAEPVADAVPDDDAPDDEYYVLDEVFGDDDFDPTVAPAGGPDWIRLRLGTADLSQALPRVLTTLDSDPRVLRRPAPAVTASGGTVEISFAVLPTLPLGERGNLERLVRSAAG